MKLRKLVVQVEELHREADRELASPPRKVTVAAVIANPNAGAYVEDLSPLYDLGAEVSGYLTDRALAALGATAAEIENYGKAAIVGTDGEIEHAAALIHPKFGAPVRGKVDGTDIIPSTKKIGAPGAAITFPLTGKASIWDLGQMDAAEITIPDSPRADEVVVILALGIGGRPLKRIALPQS